MENQLCFFFATMLQHTSWFRSRIFFFSKEQHDNTCASPILSWRGSGWFLPAPSIEISIDGTALLWFYWHHLECDGRAEKAFTKVFQECFQHHYSRWQKHIVPQTEYCEENIAWMIVVFCVSQKQSDSGNILKPPRIIGIKHRQTIVRNRREWRKTVLEAKVHNGL